MEESDGDVDESCVMAENIAFYTSTPRFATTKPTQYDVPGELTIIEVENVINNDLDSSDDDADGDFSEAIFEPKKMRMDYSSESSDDDVDDVYDGDFSHPENRFSKCDKCSKIKAELRENLDPKNLETILQDRSDHVQFVRLERQLYLKRGILGHQRPNKYLSIPIDGMDQNKTELPFSTLRYNVLSTAWRLKVHVVGVMIHGRNPIVFLDHQQHAHDSNLTANILLQITVSFLPKGHTHVDVDQLFSRLSVAIGRNGCLTPTALRRLIGTCYQQAQGDVTQAGAKPQVAQLQQLYAIREWLKPHSWPVHYLRPFHQFRFFLDERGKCLTDFKPSCQDKYHKKCFRYMPPSSNQWLLDELMDRERPNEDEQPHLGDVLRKSQSLDNGEGLIPAYTGPYRRPGSKQQIEDDQDTQDVPLQVGVLVAVNVSTYPERPQIGKIVKTERDTIEIDWLIGTWTTQWKPHKVRRGKESIVWRECVQKSSVLSSGFTLTPGNKLREATKRELKALYDNGGEELD
ncbi:Nipped-B-like protein A [Exaiptasia diaphana]|nr:Nipped-B-like protein A [Exaiptasia diaphana]